MRGSLNCQKASMTTMSERQSYLQVDLFVRLPWSCFMLYSLTARGAQTGWWQRRWLCLGGRPPANQTLRSSWLLWRLTTDQAEQVESFGGQPVTREGGAGQALLPQPVCKVKSQSFIKAAEELELNCNPRAELQGWKPNWRVKTFFIVVWQGGGEPGHRPLFLQGEQQRGRLEAPASLLFGQEGISWHSANRIGGLTEFRT